MNCPRCGLDLASAKKHCPECGFNLEAYNASGPAPARQCAPAETLNRMLPPPLHAQPVATPPPLPQQPPPIFPPPRVDLHNMMPCPTCGQLISRKAEACPRCGQPIVYNPPPGSPARPIVIEQTAKQWKGLQLVGMCVMILGVVSCITAASGQPPAEAAAAVFGLLAIVGFFIFVAGRLGAWWHHG